MSSPIDLDPTTELEEELRAAETAARAMLAEHAEVKAAAAAALPRKRRELLRLVERAFGPQMLEHSETRYRRSTLAPHRCMRCAAAFDLLVYANEIRFSLRNGAGEAAAFYALRVGAIRLRLALAEMQEAAAEATAYHERQATFARHERGPFIDEKRLRNRQIAEWNKELLTYPSGKRREKDERVRMIHERCQKTYRDTTAEADYLGSKELKERARVWKIGEDRINQLLPRRTKKNS